MYRVGIETVPQGTPALDMQMAAESVIPPSPASRNREGSF
jgi:hypothetical protein